MPSLDSNNPSVGSNSNNNNNNALTSKRTLMSVSSKNITVRRKKPNSPPYVYLAHAIKNQNYDSNSDATIMMDPNAEFTILAAVTQVIPPLNFRNGEYSLSVVLDDGSASVHANLSDDFIRQLIGVPARQFESLVETHPEERINRSREMGNILATMVSAMVVKPYHPLLLPPPSPPPHPRHHDCRCSLIIPLFTRTPSHCANNYNLP